MLLRHIHDLFLNNEIFKIQNPTIRTLHRKEYLRVKSLKDLTFSYAPNFEKTQEAVIGRKGSRQGKRCPLPIGHLVSNNKKTPKEQSNLLK